MFKRSGTRFKICLWDRYIEAKFSGKYVNIGIGRLEKGNRLFINSLQKL